MIIRVADGDINANTTWRLSQLFSPTFVPHKWDSEWKSHARVATTASVELSG